VARVAVPKPELPKKARTNKSVKDAVVGRRRVDFDAHGIHEATIYNGEALEPGMELSGPAVIQEPVVTLVVAPRNRVTVDDFGSYHVHLHAV